MIADLLDTVLRDISFSVYKKEEEITVKDEIIDSRFSFWGRVNRSDYKNVVVLI